MDNSILSIKIYDDGVFSKTLVFSENPENEEIKYMGIIKIGRMSTAHIKLDSPSVSRMHGTIEFQDGNFLFSLMARSDTYINNNKIEESKVILKEKDEIKIGEISIVVYPGLREEDIEDDVNESVIVDDSEDEISELRPPEELFEEEVEEKLIHSDELAVQGVKSEDAYFKESQEEDSSRATIGKGLEVKHYWHGNMVDSRLFTPDEVATIGASETDSFYVNEEYLPNKASFTIASNGKDVNFFPNNVYYIEGSEEYTLEELIDAQKVVMKAEHGAIRLLYQTKISFELEENRFEISAVPIYAPIAKKPYQVFLEGLNPKYSIISLFIHMVLVLLMYLTPPEIESFNLEKLNNIPERYANVILEVPEKKEKKEEIKFENKGKKEVVKYDNSAKNNGDVVFTGGKNFKNLTRKQIKIKKLVHNTGMLGALNRGGGGLNTSSGTFGGFEDDKIRLDDNSGNAVIANSGNPGIRGGASGPGGGNRSIGTGGPSTGSAGRYASSRYNKGLRGMPGGKKRSRRLRVKIKEDMITGNLTRRQIENVVKRHVDQIRYCYEKELLRKPKLKGVIIVIWKINPRGKVFSVKIGGGTLKDAVVQQCVAQRIKTWKFPEPKGGGLAKVKYPFNFRSN